MGRRTCHGAERRQPGNRDRYRYPRAGHDGRRQRRAHHRLGTDALTKGTGSTDLRQALGQTVPSFTAQQFGGDTANLTLSAALRGLSPNDTLVLVNGKRRHYTGNLHVDSGDFASGSSGADISLIPEAAIDHVEVLLDGAAAQYGTDAIAGVVNIILKKKSSGGTLTATAGRRYDGRKGENGDSYDVSFNMGMPLFDKGFVNVTVQKTFSNFTRVAGCDIRVCNGDGSLVTDPAALGFPLSVAQGMVDYPRINPIAGAAPQQQLTQGAVNMGYDFSDNFSVYGFGTVSHRVGKGYENVRMPNKVLANAGTSQPCSATNPNGYSTGFDPITGNATCNTGSAIPGSAAPGTPGAGLNSKGQIIFTSSNVGNYTDPGELIPAPEGFRPYEGLKEDDYQYNMGTKFNVLGWDTDVDVGYGKDIDNIYTNNSLNRSLFIDTHTSPTNFYDGTFTSSQFTGTIDATHQFNVGMASPLTVAIGAEAREDLYAIAAGDTASQYKEGGNSFPGFLSSDAGVHSRKNYAGYIDLALAPIEALQLDLAGRAEHYTDFGDTQIGKFTARYDFSPQIAVRGTIATGFRAPTIAEEFYTATNVSPTAATVQLPADSAAAKILGLQNLKPETSTSYSAGIVAHPIEDMSVTVDCLQHHRRQPHRSGWHGAELRSSGFGHFASGSRRDRGIRQDTRSDGDPGGRHRLRQRPQHPDPGRGYDHQLSDRFRRYGPDRLDLGGQLQYDLGVQRGAEPAGVRRLGCAALPAQYAVQFRAQRAGRKRLPSPPTGRWMSLASPSARPIGARRRTSPPRPVPRPSIPMGKRAWA